MIKAEFGSIYKFCRETELPPATVKMLILGNLGSAAEANAVNRVNEALRAHRPHLDMSGVWARQVPAQKNNLVIEVPQGKRAIEITFTVSVNFK